MGSLSRICAALLLAAAQVVWVGHAAGAPDPAAARPRSAAAPATRGGAPDAGAPTASWLDRLEWVNATQRGARDLSGKVVVVEFWTFDCINCRRTVPAMKKLEARYRGARDLLILGIHTPELERERDPVRVRQAVERLGIEFPVAQDNDYAAWRAFDNHYWPALYLLDRRGAIRYRHVGELHPETRDWRGLVREIERLREEPR